MSETKLSKYDTARSEFIYKKYNQLQDAGFLEPISERLKVSAKILHEIYDEGRKSAIPDLSELRENVEKMSPPQKRGIIEMRGFNGCKRRVLSLIDSHSEPQKDVHPEDKCQECGSGNPTWHAPNELWNKVMGSPNGIICPRCFQDKASALGLTVHTVLDLISKDVLGEVLELLKGTLQRNEINDQLAKGLSVVDILMLVYERQFRSLKSFAEALTWSDIILKEDIEDKRRNAWEDRVAEAHRFLGHPNVIESSKDWLETRARGGVWVVV